MTIDDIKKSYEEVKHLLYSLGFWANYDFTNNENLENDLSNIEKTIQKIQKIQITLEQRIGNNKKLIKENYDTDTEVVSHLEVENTALEFVLMMLEE